MSVRSLILSAAGAQGGGPPPPPPVPPYTTSGCMVYYDPALPQSYSGSGSTISDLSGNGNDGTINNATFDAATAEGVFNLVAAAGNNYIITPNLYSLMIAPSAANTQMTIEIWTRASSNGSVVMEVGQNNITTGYRGNNIELGNTGPFFAPRGGYRNVGGTTTYNGPATSGALNQWNQYVVVFIGLTPIMYRNGANKGGTLNNAGRSNWWQASPIAGQTNNYYALAFGAGSAQNTLNLTSAMFNGKMGVMRAYNRPLTDAEILANYNGLKSRYGLP